MRSSLRPVAALLALLVSSACAVGVQLELQKAEMQKRATQLQAMQDDLGEKSDARSRKGDRLPALPRHRAASGEARMRGTRSALAHRRQQRKSSRSPLHGFIGDCCGSRS